MRTQIFRFCSVLLSGVFILSASGCGYRSSIIDWESVETSDGIHRVLLRSTMRKDKYAQYYDFQELMLQVLEDGKWVDKQKVIDKNDTVDGEPARVRHVHLIDWETRTATVQLTKVVVNGPNKTAVYTWVVMDLNNGEVVQLVPDYNEQYLRNHGPNYWMHENQPDYHPKLER